MSGDGRAALRPFEKAWAEALFEAVLGPVEDEGLPSFASVDRATFWRALDTAPTPSFGPGLRVMVHALTFMPVAKRSFRRPFHALSREDRARFVELVASDERYLVRQMLTTMKMLACFAYFDDDGVRSRFAGDARS